jgi:hypothetical protein
MLNLKGKYPGPRRLYPEGFCSLISLCFVSTTLHSHICAANRQQLSLRIMFGLINRTLLLWLNGLFWKGAHGLITVDDLPSIDEELKSASLRQHMNFAWNKRRKFLGYLSPGPNAFKVGANRDGHLFSR